MGSTNQPQVAGATANLAERLDAVLAKRAKEPFVLLADQRAYDDTMTGFVVDLIDFEEVMVGDTSSRWFLTFEMADTFATDLAYLLILDIERVL